MSLGAMLPRLLLVLGVGFLIANLRIFAEFFAYIRRRRTALLVWPGPKPPYYWLVRAIGVVLGVLVLYNLVFLRRAPAQVFGEAMMFLYYAYAVPLSQRIGRGFYADGIWAESGFMPYWQIGGISWREGEEITLVLISRLRSLSRRLIVPAACYAAARRLLRDKIAAHDIQFSGATLDLGVHDERDDI